MSVLKNCVDPTLTTFFFQVRVRIPYRVNTSHWEFP